MDAQETSPTVSAVPTVRQGFWVLWSASAVSSLGDGMRAVAFPLLAASLTRNPVAIATVFAAGYAPWPLFGLYAGAIVDRADRRDLMWRINTIRALVVAAFTVMVGEAEAPVIALAATSFLVGTAETLVANASLSMVPQLVERSALHSANARLQIAQILCSTVIGMPFGVLLFAIGHAIPFAGDATSFAVAALLIRTIPGSYRPEQAAPKRSLTHELIEGLRWLLRNRFLRTAYLLIIVVNTTLGAGEAVLVLYNRDELKQGDLGYTLLLTAMAIGAISGSLAASRLRRKLSLPVITVGSAAGQATALVIAGFTSQYVIALAGMALVGLAVGCWNVTITSYRQSAVPAHLLGRVTSSSRVIALTATPIGAELGGLAARGYGLHAVYLIGGCALLTATLAAARSLGPDPVAELAS
jgi:predicted MFS family arabinose efflux permease